ncbi:MAG: adenylyltransferase/cytidyltransferase family protein [Candidatus Pacebacteria bacterium]|nr:adenylyltransferase/cytidyltransferase family protein [Candidatus Paceibacterota bacterium]
MEKNKLGLFIGKFQPEHNGHYRLIKRMIEENREVIICIGSAQIKTPFTIEERVRKVKDFLETLNLESKKIRIKALKDIKSDKEWPVYLKKRCGITDDTENTFYTGDNDLPEDYISDMKELGFKIKIVERNQFEYKGPDGKNYIFTCATQIRDLYKELGLEI